MSVGVGTNVCLCYKVSVMAAAGRRCVVWGRRLVHTARCVQSALPITPLTPHAITNPTHSSSTNSCTLPTLPTPSPQTLPTYHHSWGHSTAATISCSRLTLLNPHLAAFYLSCEGQNYLLVDRQISAPRVFS